MLYRAYDHLKNLEYKKVPCGPKPYLESHDFREGPLEEGD